jgi:hypothetical protein
MSEKTDWSQYMPRHLLSIPECEAAYAFYVHTDPDEQGNWFTDKLSKAKRHVDFVFEINGEQFELTGAEMLEALRAHAASRVIEGDRG